MLTRTVIHKSCGDFMINKIFIVDLVADKVYLTKDFDAFYSYIQS